MHTKKCPPAVEETLRRAELGRTECLADNPILTPVLPPCQAPVLKLIDQARRLLAREELAAAEATQTLDRDHHMKLAARHRAILHALEQLANKEGQTWASSN